MLKAQPCIAIYLAAYPAAFEVRTIGVDELAHGTPLEGSMRLKSSDKKAWVDGDLIRLLTIWAYGREKIWVDMDSLLTRDLKPLLEHEFVTQWDCYGVFPSPALFGWHIHILESK